MMIYPDNGWFNYSQSVSTRNGLVSLKLHILIMETECQWKMHGITYREIGNVS